MKRFIQNTFFQYWNEDVIYECKRQLRMYLYYFVLFATLRFMLGYQNNLETQYYAGNNASYKIKLLYFLSASTVFRYAVGNTCEYIISYGYRNIQKEAQQKFGADVTKKQIIQHYSSHISKALNNFIGLAIILSCIGGTALLILLNIFSILKIQNISIYFTIAFAIAICTKTILIINNILRSTNDIFGTNIVSSIAAGAQVLIPTIVYLILIKYNYSITLATITFASLFAAIISLIINAANVFTLLKNTIFPTFNNISSYKSKVLQLLPGEVLKNTIIFNFTELLLGLTPFTCSSDNGVAATTISDNANTQTDIKLDAIFSYKATRNIRDSAVLPCLTALRITYVQSKSTEIYLRAAELSNMLIITLGSIFISVMMQTKLYTKIFYISSEFSSHIGALIMITFPIHIATRYIMVFNLVQGYNKMYNTLVLFSDLGTFVFFNVVLYMLSQNYGIGKILAYTVIVQAILYFSTTLAIAKYYDQAKIIKIKSVLMHQLLLIVTYLAVTFMSNKILQIIL